MAKVIELTEEPCPICGGRGKETFVARPEHLRSSASEPRTEDCRQCKGTGFVVTKRVTREQELTLTEQLREWIDLTTHGDPPGVRKHLRDQPHLQAGSIKPEDLRPGQWIATEKVSGDICALDEDLWTVLHNAVEIDGNMICRINNGASFVIIRDAERTKPRLHLVNIADITNRSEY